VPFSSLHFILYLELILFCIECEIHSKLDVDTARIVARVRTRVGRIVLWTLP
jgi:hypothetical protein